MIGYSSQNYRQHSSCRPDTNPSTAATGFGMLIGSVQVQCCLTSTETVRTIRDGEPRAATSTLTQLLSSEVRLLLQCRFTSTDRDGEPRTATSTFSPGRPPRLSAQDGHLDFQPRTATSTFSPGRPPRLSAQDGHLDFQPRTATSTFSPGRPPRLSAQDGHLDFQPRTATSTFSPGRPPRLSHSS